jgi:hypothetical protein
VTVAGWLIALVVWTIVSGVLLVVSIVLTNPLTIGPAGVTLWFVILYLFFSSFSSLILFGAKSYLRLHATTVGRLRYSWRQGLLTGGWMVGMLSLSSLRQLGVLDAILLGILLVIVEVYVRLRWP